ncbi:MAG: DUF881 domain-containing protein [Clostridiaceae bacterium]|nr:DUF881 domain-containing protein [Clostridiaceae bacterium]
MKPLFWRKKFNLSNQLRHHLLMFVIMLLFGFIVMNHIQSVRAADKTSNMVILYKERQEQLKQYEEQYKKLLAENDQLNAQKEAAIANLLNRQGNENLLDELQKIKILAGFTEVKGPGVIITLNDKPGYDILVDSKYSLVHDSDIRRVIDLLRNAGAGAFSVNGLRITNASFVLCIGPIIRCNNQRMLPPYVITAIGDPAVLAEAITTDQEFNTRQTAGIDLVVKVQQEQEVTIPAFAEADDFYSYISLLEDAAP